MFGSDQTNPSKPSPAHAGETHGYVTSTVTYGYLLSFLAKRTGKVEDEASGSLISTVKSVGSAMVHVHHERIGFL